MKYSQYKAMMAVARASFRSITRSPSAVVFTLVFPLIFILVFGFIDGGSVHLNVGVSENSDTSNPVYYHAHQLPAMQLYESENDSEMMNQLSKGELDAVLHISRIPGQDRIIVDLKTSTSSGEKGVIARSMFEHIIDKSNLEAAKVTEPMAQLKQSTIAGRAYKTIDFI